jgi:hypothetical protein
MMLEGAKMAKKGKSYPTKMYPQSASSVSDLFERMEPLITPSLVKSRYLHGVDISDYSEEEIKQEIWLACQEVELLLNMPLFPIEITEGKPYEYNHYSNYWHFKTERRPVQSIIAVEIVSADGQVVWKAPQEWISTALIKTKSQINFIPLLSTIAGGSQINTGDTTGNSIFLQAMGHARWIPSFWRLKYIAGLGDCEGNMPVLINDLIGLSASTEILSAKQNQFIHGSQSLGQDGISQSSSLKNGGNVYQARIDMLTQRRQMIIERVKMVFNNKYFISNL